MAKNLSSVLDELFPVFFLYHQDIVIAYHFILFPNTVFSVILYQEIDHINWKLSLTRQHANWPKESFVGECSCLFILATVLKSNMILII